MTATTVHLDKEADAAEKPTLLQRIRAKFQEARELHRERKLERWARRWSRTSLRAQKMDDRGSMDIIDAVIGIAIFAAVIGLIGSQITSAGANLTAFPGASTLLYLVPLILVAVLILKLWKGRANGGGGRRRGRFY